MSLNTFKGGVHPIEGKDLSKDKPVKELLPGKELAFPLSQHIGAPARAIVAAGDTVLRGQMIAEAGGFVSAPIYASVSGKVKGIEPRLGAVGAVGDAIIIENDEQYQEVDFTECDEVDYLSKEEIIDKIRTAGVVGMGGAGFPTAVKMSPKNPDEIDTIIANCAECEPFLTSDYRQMMDHPEELVEGMRIILQIFGKARGFFGVENNKPDCIAKLEELVKDEPRMSVIPLKTKYPQGGERQIIYACTGRAINSKMLPADAGCIVDNVATICAIYKAVRFGIPVIDRIFTVSGDAVAEPQNFHIHIGTYMDEILAAAGGTNQEVAKYISGGPMMGFAMYDTHVASTKTTSALLAMTAETCVSYEASACINCGRCVEACPENLIPCRLADYNDRGQKELFEQWHGLECIECGSCSFVCPARRHTAQSVRLMKKQVMADKRAAAAKAKAAAAR